MMIITRKCPHCDSECIRKNGIEPLNGKQKYKCLSCNRYGTLGAAPKYSDEKKQMIMNAYFERPSMRGIERMFNVSRHTLSSWLKKAAALPENTSLSACIIDVPSDDILEFDEVHSYVKKKQITDGYGQLLAERLKK